MNCLTIFFLAIMLISASMPAQQTQKKQPKKLVFMDGISVVYSGAEGTDLIMHSEIARPKLDGTPNTREEMVKEMAFAQEARKWKLFPSREDVKKQLKKNEDELNPIFTTLGYSPDEGLNAFAQMNAINSLLSFKISASLVVPESEVIAYYNDHPENEPARLSIAYTLVPFSKSQSVEKQAKYLEEVARSGDPKKTLQWQDSFWINLSDLAQDKQFLVEMQKGDISSPQQTSYGFELYQLRDMHEGRMKPLDERYGEIVTILRQPKYFELMEKFQKDLMDSASIIYFDLPH